MAAVEQGQQRSRKEVLGRKLIYGGIIAGALGIIAAIPLIEVVGVTAAVGGIVFESSASKGKKQG